MKSQRITFRLSPYQLARGLETIRQLEPNYKLISLNDIVKTIYHDYLAKMSFNRREEISANILNEIRAMANKPSSSLTIDDMINIQKPAPSMPEAEAEETETLEIKQIPETIEQTEDSYDPDEELSTELLEEIAKMNALSERLKASSFKDPNKTESTLSTLTDFSPPTEWKEGEES